ncbi:MAG: hypothetical protein JNL05_04560 [Flavobacteriales bacterium]|nr:hypothetical protein [Flavobacteriales bacterium]
MTVVEHPLLVLTPRPWKWLGVLMGSLVLGFGGWLMITDPDTDARQGMGWFCLVLFGLSSLVAIIQLIPGSSRVVVTSKGIYHTAMYRRRFFAWTDIERFGVAEWTQWHGPFRQRHRLVGIRFKAGSQVCKRWRRASLLSEAMVGYHGALSDNYGYKHQELSDLLNQLLAAHRP